MECQVAGVAWCFQIPSEQNIPFQVLQPAARNGDTALFELVQIWDEFFYLIKTKDTQVLKKASFNPVTMHIRS